MPGHSSLSCADCVNLSAMPGIHVFASFKQKHVDGWDKPGHDAKKYLVHFQPGSDEFGIS